MEPAALMCCICLDVMLPPKKNMRVAALRTCGHLIHQQW